MLILMRHAARDFSGDQLSAEGLRQSLLLHDLIKSATETSPTALHSSPKLRTRLTLRPLEEKTQLKAVIDPRLDERAPNETMEAFVSRVETFLEESEASDEKACRVACSHLDWLEEAALRLTSDESDFERAEPWSPMAFRAYILNEGIWKRMRVKA